jgi:peroxiredoxin
MLAEGHLAPDFQLADWRLSDALKTGPVLLAFYKIACPTCQFTLPFLQRLANTQGLQVVTISQDDARSTGQFAERFGISLPVLLDQAPYPVSNLYGIRNVPTLYLIEPGARIAMAGTGFSRASLQSLAGRFGTQVFREGERVPEMRPG